MAASNRLVCPPEKWSDIRNMTEGKGNAEKNSVYISFCPFWTSLTLKPKFPVLKKFEESPSLLLGVVGLLAIEPRSEYIIYLFIYIKIYNTLVHVHVCMYTTCLRYGVSWLSKLMCDLINDSLQPGRLITFQRNILPPSSGNI